MFGRDKVVPYTERNIQRGKPRDEGSFLSRALRMDSVSQTKRQMERVHEDASFRRDCIAKIDLALDELLRKHAVTFARMSDGAREVHLRALSRFTAEAKQEILDAADPETVTEIRLRLYKHEDKQLSKYGG